MKNDLSKFSPSQWVNLGRETFACRLVHLSISLLLVYSAYFAACDEEIREPLKVLSDNVCPSPVEPVFLLPLHHLHLLILPSFSLCTLRSSLCLQVTLIQVIKWCLCYCCFLFIPCSLVYRTLILISSWVYVLASLSLALEEDAFFSSLLLSTLFCLHFHSLTYHQHHHRHHLRSFLIKVTGHIFSIYSESTCMLMCQKLICTPCTFELLKWCNCTRASSHLLQCPHCKSILHWLASQRVPLIRSKVLLTLNLQVSTCCLLICWHFDPAMNGWIFIYG